MLTFCPSGLPMNQYFVAVTCLGMSEWWSKYVCATSVKSPQKTFLTLQSIVFIASINFMKNAFPSIHSTKIDKRDNNTHVRSLSILFRCPCSNILCF